MTPLSDIEKLEQAIADDAERCHAYFFHASEENKNAASAAREYRNDLLFRLAPSLIADWKQMRGDLQYARDTMNEILRKYQPAGSPPPGGLEIGVSYTVGVMADKIERLTKELDEAYELVAQKVDGLSEYTKYSKDFIADLIRGLKAKEE